MKMSWYHYQEEKLVGVLHGFLSSVEKELYDKKEEQKIIFNLIQDEENYAGLETLTCVYNRMQRCVNTYCNFISRLHRAISYELHKGD
jgi:hypothetical protein